MLKKTIRVGELAKAAGVSVQTIRNYERWGFLPAVERSATGYRHYTQRHIQAMWIARVLIGGYSWECARKIMHAVHQGNLAAALAEIDAKHAEIHRNRQEIEATLRILRTTSETLPTLEHIPRYRSGMRVGEVAKSVGVRVSAVRFWEDKGLLQPQRDQESRYRVYDAEQMRKLQVVVLLRKAGYDFATIANVLDQLAHGTSEQAVQAAEQRLQELAEQSRRCAEGTALLWEYVTS